MARKLRSYVKFFPARRRVILLTLMPDIGTVTVADGIVTLDKSDRRVYRPISQTIIPPGTGSPDISALLIVGEYTNREGIYGDSGDDHATPPTAQIQTTVTNDPPGAPTPIPYDINETEDNP